MSGLDRESQPERPIKDKKRTPKAARVLRQEPWCEAIYCADVTVECDRTLRELHAFFPGRSPELMVDIADDASISRRGAHWTDERA